MAREQLWVCPHCQAVGDATDPYAYRMHLLASRACREAYHYSVEHIRGSLQRLKR